MAGLAKRSLSLAGQRTSLALEPEFWRVLEAMAAAGSLSLAGLVAQVDGARGERPLASACRLAALAHALGAAPLGKAQSCCEIGLVSGAAAAGWRMWWRDAPNTTQATNTAISRARSGPRSRA